MLNIVDDVTRECLAAIPDTLISRCRVARELTDIIAWRDKPGMIVSDNVLGREAAAENGQQVSLRRASRCRTATSRASTGGCGTNC